MSPAYTEGIQQDHKMDWGHENASSYLDDGAIERVLKYVRISYFDLSNGRRSGTHNVIAHDARTATPPAMLKDACAKDS